MSKEELTNAIESAAREIMEFQSKCVENDGALLLKADVTRIMQKRLEPHSPQLTTAQGDSE